VVRDTLPSINSFGRFFRQHSRFGLGTALAALLLAGSLTIAGNTPAQAQSQEACVEACKAEKKKCTDNMATEEMCSSDLKECTKACEKK
jgi:hypothetical protein